MKAITRIRIILFALMVFGAFANFALNDWGNTLIVWCEIFMALSFLWEMTEALYKRFKANDRKKLSMLMLSLIGIILFSIVTVSLVILLTGSVDGLTDMLVPVAIVSFLLLVLIIIAEALIDFFKKKEPGILYENVFLFLFFTALVFKNASMPATGAMLVFSILFLVPYFITSTVKFFRANFALGKSLTIVLTFGSVATVLLGIAYMMKTMHWPFATIIFFIAMAITLVMIGGTIKWSYEFNGKKMNILEGLGLFKTNVILLFFMLFVFTTYRYFTTLKLAPDFYSADYPESFYKLGSGTADDWQKASDIREAYNNFVEKAEINGFIK